MNLHTLINEPDTTVALVGASENSMKYGNRIFRNLTSKGIPVYPVNPKQPVVEGVIAFANLAELETQPTIVNVVIPPHLGPSIVQQVADLGWDNIWFQPGAESREAHDLANELGITVLDDGSCIMVSSTRSRRPGLPQ